jgi:nitroreductase
VSAIASIITGRRTIHEFQPEPVPPEELVLAGLDAARWAPNHHHVEPWRFYLPGPETREAICRLNAELLAASKGPASAEKKLQRWRAIPGWLVLTSEQAADPVRDRENYAACCCAVQNLALFLWEQGVGLKWSTGPVIREPRFYNLLGADAGKERVVGLFWYGYAVEVPKMKRKPLEERLSRLP